MRHLCFLSMLALAATLSAVPACAEEPTPEAEAAIEAARNGGARIKITPRTGMPRSVSGLKGPPARSALSAAATREPTEKELKTAFEAHFRLGSLRAAYAASNPEARVVSTSRVAKDREIPGQYITEGEQRVRDIPVFASKARAVMNRSLSVLSASSNLSRVAIQSLEPSIAEAEAVAPARKKLAELIARPSAAPQLGPRKLDAETADAKAALQIFDPALIASRGQVTGATRLAWMVSIETFRIFVDARTGEVFYYFRDHRSATLVRRVFDLANTGDFPGRRVIDQETRERNEPVPGDAAVAFQYTELVHQYFEAVLNRKGFDDSTLRPSAAATKGVTLLESYVRYGEVPNAYWCTHQSDYCPKADIMIYGPGFAGALDVVGHEMTHGVIAYEADLLYADEPGAVNESLADIFGSLIEHRVRGAQGNWKIAESLPGFEQVPMRDLKNPHLAAADGAPLFHKDKDFDTANRGQPDHWDEFVRRVDPMCSSLLAEDNGCVHLNSGILNKMASLIADGGTHHAVAVGAVGHDKLARIAYRSLTAHLNTGSGMQEAAEAFVRSCEELSVAGAGDLKPDDCDQVRRAAQAVGLVAPEM